MLELILIIAVLVYIAGSWLSGMEAGGKTTWNWGWPLQLPGIRRIVARFVGTGMGSD